MRSFQQVSIYVRMHIHVKTVTFFWPCYSLLQVLIYFWISFFEFHLICFKLVNELHCKDDLTAALQLHVLLLIEYLYNHKHTDFKAYSMNLTHNSQNSSSVWILFVGFLHTDIVFGYCLWDSFIRMLYMCAQSVNYMCSWLLMVYAYQCCND